MFVDLSEQEILYLYGMDIPETLRQKLKPHAERSFRDMFDPEKEVTGNNFYQRGKFELGGVMDKIRKGQALVVSHSIELDPGGHFSHEFSILEIPGP
jgi:hypothetical protein